MTVTSGQMEYPDKEEIVTKLKQAAKTITTVAGTQTALDLGNVMCFNIVVLGALSRILDGDPDLWRNVVKDRVPPKVVDLNAKAYDTGYGLIE